MRVLLAEDDDETGGFIESGMADLGHEVVRVGDGEQAVHLGTTEAFDVIVLDRMMPALDGLEVLRRLRAAGIVTPMLVLTAMGGIADRVDGLDAGADDYLVKPYAFSELVARLNALTRRMPTTDAATRIEIGGIVLDLLRRQVTREGKSILLQPREFALLEQLMRNPGRIVTRTMFLERVWGFHFDPLTNIVESNLSRLRSKLRDGFDDDPIKNIRGVGYRISADG